MIDEDLLHRTLATALGKGADFAEVFAEERTGTSASPQRRSRSRRARLPIVDCAPVSTIARALTPPTRTEAIISRPRWSSNGMDTKPGPGGWRCERAIEITCALAL